MELNFNGKIVKKANIKSENGEIRYKLVENSDDLTVFGILKTHVNSENKEVLDFFDYKKKEIAEEELNSVCEKAQKAGAEVYKENLTDDEPVMKHYIFSDESKAITYEDNYSSLEEAQAFNELLIKQFGKKFTFHEE